MSNPLNNVLEFHKAFGCEIRMLPEIPNGPHDYVLQQAYDQLMQLRSYLRLFAKEDNRCQRIALDVEELAELTDALRECNLVKTLDALVDKEYINCGTAITYGMHGVMPEAGNRAHTSNMTKLGANGKPVYDQTGKVTKGPNYRPVDLTDLVSQSKGNV